MVKASVDMRMKAVLLYREGIRSAREICSMYGTSDRTLRRWRRSYELKCLEGLEPRKTGPREAKHAIGSSLKQRILVLKQEYPGWGARRIKHQFDLSCHWKTVHNVIKKNGLLIRIKPKPQPCKRFQRKHVDSLWQGDTFQFRIRGVGKVYVTGFKDDRSRYRIVSKAYLHKSKKEAIDALQHAVKKGRIPKQIYLDNAKQFIAKEYQDEAVKHHIKLIYGRPHHPRGRGKIESYHRTLYRELISQTEFKSLPHFRKELRKFDRKYNNWRKLQAHGWQTPASIYNDKNHLNKTHKGKLQKRT